MAAAGNRADVRIGVSGWRYPPWRGTFYPKGLAQSKELAFASRAMRSIEINGSFYSLQRPSSYARWYADTPDDFVFAVKGGRFMTHNKKLRDCGPPLANFFASGVLALHEKLGPILWQLPPQLAFDRQRLEDFFGILPRTTAQAARLAEKHDQRLKSPAFFSIREDRPLRHAIEVRHESYRDPAFVRLLREHEVAFCIADTAGRWPSFEDLTSDFVYVRLHGAKELYVSGYSGVALDGWAERIAAWRDAAVPPPPSILVAKPGRRRRRDVFVYFDNDVKVRAPYDAMNLAARLGHGHRVAHLVGEVANLPPGRALDAGCGHGADTLWLAAHGWRVTAVDFSASALARGRSGASLRRERRRRARSALVGMGRRGGASAGRRGHGGRRGGPCATSGLMRVGRGIRPSAPWAAGCGSGCRTDRAGRSRRRSRGPSPAA